LRAGLGGGTVTGTAAGGGAGVTTAGWGGGASSAAGPHLNHGRHVQPEIPKQKISNANQNLFLIALLLLG